MSFQNLIRPALFLRAQNAYRSSQLGELRAKTKADGRAKKKVRELKTGSLVPAVLVSKKAQ